MKISVVIPCHNCGPWIQGALRSVMVQTVPAYEIVVVNDRSSDDSDIQIAACNAQVRLIHTDFGNAAAARDVGVHTASGDWIAFLDADDVWYPSHLEAARDALIGTNSVAYMASADYVTESGDMVAKVNRWDIETVEGELNANKFIEMFLYKAYYCNVTLVFKKEKFLEIGGHDHSFRWRHDVELFLRLIRGSTWAFNPTPQARVLLQRAGSITSSTNSTSYWLFKAFAKNKDLYDSPCILALLRKLALISLGAELRQSNSEKVQIQYSESKQYLTHLDAVKYWIRLFMLRVRSSFDA